MSIMVTRPAESAVAVTPSNTVDLAKPTRGVYVGVSGDLKVDLAGLPLTTVTFTGLASGVIHPIQVRRIYATGTTATLILAIS